MRQIHEVAGRRRLAKQVLNRTCEAIGVGSLREPEQELLRRSSSTSSLYQIRGFFVHFLLFRGRRDDARAGIRLAQSQNMPVETFRRNVSPAIKSPDAPRSECSGAKASTLNKYARRPFIAVWWQNRGMGRRSRWSGKCTSICSRWYYSPRQGRAERNCSARLSSSMPGRSGCTATSSPGG